MKKIYYLLILILLVFPFVVVRAANAPESLGAEVLDDVNIETKCDNEVANNPTYKTQGFYVEKIKVSCTNGKNVLTVDTAKSPLFNAATICTNGNTNPYLETPSDGLAGFKEGEDCSPNEGVYAFGTKVYTFDCRYVANEAGKDEEHKYNPTTEPMPETTTIPSPQTGIEDYILTLVIVGVILVGSLVVLEKKNVFKKI